jgi:transposase
MAEASGLSKSTIGAFEAKGEDARLTTMNNRALVEAFERAGVQLTPIEQFFAKLKELLRKAAARTKEALWQAIGRHLDEFTPEECRNYFAHCGYEP